VLLREAPFGTKDRFRDNYVVHKFGHNPAIASGNTEDIREAGGTITIPTTGVQLDMSSSAVADAGQNFLIQSVDGNYDRTEQLANTNGRTRVQLTHAAMIPYRAINLGPLSLAGDLYIYDRTEDSVTNGVPQTASKILLKIAAGANQTETTVFPIPNGYHGWITKMALTLGELAGGTARQATVNLLVRPKGGVFLDKGEFGLQSAGTSAFLYEPCEDVADPDFLDYPGESGMSGGTVIKFAGEATEADCNVSINYKVRLFKDS